jgi:methylated-DNA-[protein]-cysteine S-methyltransferase
MKDATYCSVYASPIGDLLLTSDGSSLTGLHLGANGKTARASKTADSNDPILLPVREQLDDYFAGRLTRFDVPLAPEGTPFQKRVWKVLCQVPYGETISYSELARRAGRPGAARAVGMAMGRNPIAIIVPCHRVIAADGSLGGFGGGLDRKRKLLALEGTSCSHASAKRR